MNQIERDFKKNMQEKHEEMNEQKLAEEARLNPFEYYRKMRQSDPVSYDEKNNFWTVFRYEDVLRVITDYRTFSSEGLINLGQEQSNLGMNGISEEDMSTEFLTVMDPPRHHQLRSLVSQVFTPRAITQLTSRITQIVHEYLDKVAATGRMDIIQDLSYPLPVIVIAELLGVPIEDRAQFKRWSDGFADPTPGAANAAIVELNRYFRSIIAQRRGDPQEDLISGLAAAEMDGKKLSDKEMLGLCSLLLVAGNITTTNLIGNAMLCFDEHPEVMDQLRDDVSLLPAAIEEVLRYRSPAQWVMRVASTETILGGKEIRQGQVLIPYLGSANCDEAQFPDPEVFDIRRTPNRHVAFGHGIHFCLGAPLARLETKIALEALLTRFRNIRRLRETRLEPLEGGGGFYGVKRLPITFQA